MRDRTRSYTTDLPRIGLPFLANMRSRLADAEPGTQLYTQTESGTLYAFRQADSYAMTINGVTRAIRTTTTKAGYGVREWYACPHCMKRAAKLYIGKKDIGCRACWKLHYKSQSADILDRMRMKIRQQRCAIWAAMTLPIICLMTFACSQNQRGCAGLRLTGSGQSYQLWRWLTGRHSAR